MSRRGGSHAGDAAALALIGGLTGAVAGVWVWGGLAGLVFGRGWPRQSITSRHPHDAGGARASRQSGGRLAAGERARCFRDRWASTSRPFPCCSALSRSSGSHAARPARCAAHPRAGRAGARWASGRELSPLRSRPLTPVAGRLALGRYRGRTLSRRAAARADRVRPAAVREVGRARDPSAARMAGPGDRLVDQDRPPRRHDRPATVTWRGADLRSLRALRRSRPDVVAAPSGGPVGWGAGGRLAARGRGRARSARRGGRRLLGGRRRAATGARCCSPPRARARGSTRSSAGRMAKGRVNSITRWIAPPNELHR